MTENNDLPVSQKLYQTAVVHLPKANNVDIDAKNKAFKLKRFLHQVSIKCKIMAFDDGFNRFPGNSDKNIQIYLLKAKQPALPTKKEKVDLI